MIHEEQLIQEAISALQHAYAPYSKFAVAACVETNDHQFICGINVENASYGLTMCAERNALCSAYAQGYRKDDILAIAIVSKCDHLIMPCGACRQVMMELLQPTTPVILSNGHEICRKTVEAFMPFSFSGKDLL